MGTETRSKGLSLVMGMMLATTTLSSANSRYSRDNECFKEVRRGLRLETLHVDKYVKASSLQDCERSCNIAFFNCRAFSYSDYHTREPENCLLTREDTHVLDINDPRDFYNDRDFTFYELTSGRDCEYELDHQGSHEVCYEIVRTRMRISSRYVIRVLRTRDRQECEQECARSRDCRGFNYRYKTIGYNQYRDNCELSSRDDSNYQDFQTDDDFDFYKETSAKNCYSGNYHDGHYHSGGGSSSSGGGYGSRDECFRLAKTESSMESRIVRERLEVRDISDCEYECKTARYFTCRSYAFRYNGHNSYHRENCYLSDLEYREMSNYDLVYDREFDFYERRLYDRECGESTFGKQDSGYNVDAGDLTVSGERCYRDRCREDREGGYFFCETDFSGAWDYCCRPREVCGYSEGSEQKWCFVGVEGRDQWRPCDRQGPGRDYLKEKHPDLKLIATSSNVTKIEVMELPPQSNVNETEARLLDFFSIN